MTEMKAGNLSIDDWIYISGKGVIVTKNPSIEVFDFKSKETFFISIDKHITKISGIKEAEEINHKKWKELDERCNKFMLFPE